MRNLILFGTILSVLLISLIIGSRRIAVEAEAAELPHSVLTEHAGAQVQRPAATNSANLLNIPHIGSVQVLNGCGITGAADRMADFLRTNNFDVTNTGNAPTFNYPATMVISRTKDMSIANKIENILKTGRIALIRNNEQLYDVTVVVGPDFEEKIK